MPDPIESLIALDPFSTALDAKEVLFKNAIKSAFEHHVGNNKMFARYCKKRNLNLSAFPEKISDLPYIPVRLFKTENLVSIGSDKATKTLYSSATSGVPSSVTLDAVTSKRQSICSAKVISSYLGNERRPFAILDEDITKVHSAEVKARAAATTGFLVFANEVEFLMDLKGDQLSVNRDKIITLLKRYEESQEELCIFTFTFILYHHVVRFLLEEGIKFNLSDKCKIGHIGGWKKLEDQKVSKSKFLKDIEAVFSIKPDNVIDFYGFTEQMGLVYGNTGSEPKTVPLYADLIIRDTQTLEPVEEGEEGFIQLITPVPHSYPGISVLTEDIGHIVDRGPDKFGRNGVRFEVLGRARGAEVRGCGDIMQEYTS